MRVVWGSYTLDVNFILTLKGYLGSIVNASSVSNLKSGWSSMFTQYEIGLFVGFVNSIFFITSSPKIHEKIIGYGFGI